MTDIKFVTKSGVVTYDFLKELCLLLKEQSDEELMKLYQNGLEKAFLILYERHSARVYGFIRSKIKNKQKVEEVFQEVFMKMHRSKRLYNDTLPVLPWIFTITRSVIIDELRKSKDHLEQEFDFNQIPAESRESLQAEGVVEGYMGHLPEAQREAIKLRYFEEKTFEEIADHLSTSSVNVRQLISRGLKKLRSLMGEKP